MNNQSSASSQLENSICNQDIHKVFQILSQLNNQTPLNDLRFNGNQRSTALMLAVNTNNIAIAQLLIWNSNIINQLDGQGQTALAYARSKEMQDLLSGQGCSENSISPLTRSTNNSIINKPYQTDSNTSFSFRDKSRLKDRDAHKATQMSNLVTSDFDQLPTSII